MITADQLQKNCAHVLCNLFFFLWIHISICEYAFAVACRKMVQTLFMWAPQCREISTKASRVHVWFASGALSSLLSVLFKPYAVTFCVLDLRAVTDEWNATNAKRCTVNDVGVSNRARSLLAVSKCFFFFSAHSHLTYVRIPSTACAHCRVSFADDCTLPSNTWRQRGAWSHVRDTSSAHFWLSYLA